MKIRIYYEDTDTGGIVYHANYIKYCDRARSEMFFSSSIKPFTKDAFFVVSSIEAKYIKPAFIGDLIEVRTKILEIKKASAVLEQSIYRVEDIEKNSKDDLLFKAQIKIAFVSNLKPKKMNDEIALFFNNYNHSNH
ncbi:acyl-CoA thioesterase [Campylobacter pinnipediorum subsp. caledonicus]|uniref:Acyl-CoA thioesterase n=1 Tax=Campylobacter pinnipediorum subsp. caledonicus TaxID=1874362 RepID=A0A1S6U776_9BACT|nr:YbgC/FadM family acyl-CoA thioesterase [Campylobacter pinnipediorum]AQW85966.1 acyl-CoA thioesterase [Campylobacter pinnipediorum subsp. caledonicus]AQW87573.1 acyl-CoA thioesterase [Campylobacter pinnipediorum subsp. caledonicus]OPA72289.1 thioesterase [Campylobacter pinnipediorum subsp. caledonicus]